MSAASRVSDNHTCPMVNPNGVPHTGGPILPPCSTNVQANSLSQGRATDKATCVGPVDFIVTGAATVTVNSLPATRVQEHTMHGGVIVVGSPTVLIGGPSAGSTLGNPAQGNADCVAAAAGRNPPPGTVYPPSAGPAAVGQPIPANTPGQSYNNCGVETSRILANRANGTNVTQEQALNNAMANGWATQAPNLYDSGGTNPTTRTAILNSSGVPSSEVAPSNAGMAQATAERRGVIAVVNSGTLWGNAPANPTVGDHVVLVNGVTYDASGNITSVNITDTGNGQCNRNVPIALWNSATATNPAWNMVVTNNPVY